MLCKLRIDNKVLNENPFLEYRSDQCIKCLRFVSTWEIACWRSTILAGNNGQHSVIQAHIGPDWESTLCESCVNCVRDCLTGAIQVKKHKNYRKNEIKRTITICPHCATGCKLELLVKDGSVVDVRGSEQGPSNKGFTCVEGRNASFEFIDYVRQLRNPLKNQETGQFEEPSWVKALDLVANRFVKIPDKYCIEVYAVFTSACSTNEGVFFAQKDGTPRI
ncbi:MAG: hypothetical protein HUJ51_03360 [Eggerthellaceae bacterium]|nr:hypothetical protein [Eggerthellaceae bacterium]